MITSRTRFLSLFAICSLALLLSACKANFITEIKPDGSGTYTQELGFTADEVKSINPLGTTENFCESTENQASDLPPNTTMREEKRGEEIWCVFESPFASLEDLKAIYATTDTKINEISLTADRVVYDITLDFSQDNAMLTGALDLNWIVKMPGSITDHNATGVKGQTLTWKLTPGQVNQIRAQGKVGGLNLGGEVLWYLLGGVVFLCLCCFVPLILGGVIFFFLRRKQAASTPPAPLS